MFSHIVINVLSILNFKIIIFENTSGKIKFSLQKTLIFAKLPFLCLCGFPWLNHSYLLKMNKTHFFFLLKIKSGQTVNTQYSNMNIKKISQKIIPHSFFQALSLTLSSLQHGLGG